MSIYTFSQKSFDSQNLELSKVFDIPHTPFQLSEEERTIEKIPLRWSFKNPGYPGVGKRAAETKRRLGIPTGGTAESLARAIETKRKNGVSITGHLSKPEIRKKANDTCDSLSKRKIVSQLRELAAATKTKLGSGWVRKPDPWILQKISELNQRT